MKRSREQDNDTDGSSSRRKLKPAPPPASQTSSSAASAGEGISIPPKRKAGRKRRVPGYPKRPMSAYNLFFKDHRKEATESLEKTGDSRADFASITKFIGKLWNDLPEPERAPYEAQAKREMEQYKIACAEYEQAKREEDEKKPAANVDAHAAAAAAEPPVGEVAVLRRPPSSSPVGGTAQAPSSDASSFPQGSVLTAAAAEASSSSTRVASLPTAGIGPASLYGGPSTLPSHQLGLGGSQHAGISRDMALSLALQQASSTIALGNSPPSLDDQLLRQRLLPLQQQQQQQLQGITQDHVVMAYRQIMAEQQLLSNNSNNNNNISPLDRMVAQAMLSGTSATSTSSIRAALGLPPSRIAEHLALQRIQQQQQQQQELDVSEDSLRSLEGLLAQQPDNLELQELVRIMRQFRGGA